MDKDLQDIQEKQKQLAAMVASINDFQSKLQGQQAEFIEKYFGFKRGENVNVFDLIAKFNEKKIIL